MLDTGESFIVKLRGLPYSTTEDDVLDFLSGVRVLNGKDGIHLTETRPGRASGECFVELETEDDLELACGKDKEHMGKRYIEVFTSDRQELEWSVKHSGNGTGGGGPDIPQDAGAVKLRGLPFGCSKDEIAQFFIGLEILPDGISILSDQSGRSSGEAFVLFGNASDAQAALQRDREKIGHRYIEVFMSSPDDMRSYLERSSGNGYGGSGGFGGFGGRGGRAAPYDRPGRFDDRPSPRGNFRGNNRFSRGGGGGGPMRGPGLGGGGGGGHQVHMRGLPFKASPGDIAYFFKPIRPAKINILYEDDRPSGEADVDFECHEDAVQAMRRDKSNMEHRYIELFLNSSPGGGGGGRMGGMGMGMGMGGSGGFARNNYRNNY